MRVTVVDVGVRPDRREKLGAILGKDHVARPVAAPAQTSAAREFSQVLHRPAGLQITVLVGEPDDLVGVADVDIFGVGARRIKRNAERLVQARRKHRHLLCLAIGSHTAKYLDLPGFTLRQKDVPVWRGPQQAWILKPRGVEVYLEALGRNGPRIRRPCNNRWAVIDGLIWSGRRQIRSSEVAPRSRRLVQSICKGGLAGQTRGLGRKYPGCECQGGKQKVNPGGSTHRTS